MPRERLQETADEADDRKEKEAADDMEEMIDGRASTELSSNRTAMSFERTGMSADRTLMSIIRTSLSLIGFGFTIFQFFHTLNTKFLEGGLPNHAPRHFGLALLALGVILLVLGILDHVRNTNLLRQRRKRLYGLSIIHNVAPTRLSTALLVAIGLLGIGVMAIASVVMRVGPF